MLIFSSIAIMLIIVLDLYLKDIMIQNLFIAICFFLIFIVIQNTDMMNQLKVNIIADGIDSKELADLLVSIGIDNMEGPYFL